MASRSRPSLAALEHGAREWGIALPQGALEAFDRYREELGRWRARLNLTADLEALPVRHFLDSLLPLAVCPIPTRARIVDVGTGAGFPGVPLKLVRPDFRLALIDASRRKVAFLEHLCRTLRLADVEVAWGRAERLGRMAEWRERFDVAVERATARLPAAVELSLPFVAVGGVAILLKGPSAQAHDREAQALASAMGAEVRVRDRRTLPGTGEQRLTIVYGKVRPTPGTYPRAPARLGTPPGGTRASTDESGHRHA